MRAPVSGFVAFEFVGEVQQFVHRRAHAHQLAEGGAIEALDIVGVTVVMLGILAVQISKARVKAP